jgi:hypothetical protein
MTPRSSSVAALGAFHERYNMTSDTLIYNYKILCSGTCTSSSLWLAGGVVNETKGFMVNDVKENNHLNTDIALEKVSIAYGSLEFVKNVLDTTVAD